MTHADLVTLFDFHYWARDRVLAAVELLTPEQYTRSLGNSFTSVRDTLVHMYSAEWTWYRRWHGASPTSHLNPANYQDVDALRAAWTGHEARMRGYLATLDDTSVNGSLEYKALNGQPASSRISEMLQHVVNHGTYHRGQVTTMLRQVGAAPPKSAELIVFYRERKAAP